MGSVFEFNRKKVFSITEARELLPIIKRITEESESRVKGLLNLLGSQIDRETERSKTLEEKINRHVSDWQTKISKLGAEGKGLWLVDFDCGTGYFCWKFPEESLDHFHSYTEGFQARVRMRESEPT